MVDSKLDPGIKPARTAPPKLRKNMRLEKRWGPKYYAAVKEAVFTLRHAPYTPEIPPPSIHEEADDCQPLYVCKQCRDCFRFPSSLEAHNSRRSWILGYWCNPCFVTHCSHVPKSQQPCFKCQGSNRERIIFLRAKGLRKGRKVGCIKIFYNQCQFFAHLRGHQISIVDMADIMLMPLPTDVEKESYAKLEQLCETIMESMFLTRRHIMDWLRSHQFDNKWSRLLQSSSESNVNSLVKMLEATVKTHGGKRVKHSTKSQRTTATGLVSPGSSFVAYPSRSDPPSSVSETIESVIAQSTWDETEVPNKVKIPEMPPLTSITHIDPLEPIEDDDNPCTTTDIAFVDCGPAAKTFRLDSATVLPPKDTLAPDMSNSCSSSGNAIPAKADSHSSIRASRAPVILKQRQANNVVHTTSIPTSHRAFEPKISVKKFANERLKTSSDVLCQKNNSIVNNQPPQALKNLTPGINVRLASPKKAQASVIEIARAVETSKKTAAHPTLSALGSKILTVHSPKNADLSKIISQLPPEVINGKKIVFIGQDSDRFTILPKHDTVSSNMGMIKIQSDNEKPRILQTLPTKIAPIVVSNVGSEQSVKILSETPKICPALTKIRPKMQQVYLDGRVIYQNGKKFIIRQARKSVAESTVCTSLNNLKLQTIPKRVALSTFLSRSNTPLASSIPIVSKSGVESTLVSESVDASTNKVVLPLTPSPFTSCSTSPSSSRSPSLSPSPSTSEDPISLKPKTQIRRSSNDPEIIERAAEVSDSIKSQSLTATSLCTLPSRNIHVPDGIEYFSIETNADGKPYVDFSKAKAQQIWTQTAVNYRQQMRDNLPRLGAERIKQQIDHLKEINADYSRTIDVTEDAIILENLKAIEDLENALEAEPVSSGQDQDIDQGLSDIDINEILLDSKEISEPPSVCSTCNRSIQSDSNILEFLKGSTKSPDCCSCNNYVCHICNVFQGNMSRFTAHLKFHAKKEPFTCPECFRKFPTFHRLETHIWTTCFHLLARRWFKCKVCQVEGFPNMESVTKHFTLAHSELKIACPECGIFLKSRATFQKHIEEDHSKVTDPLKPVNLMVCQIGNCVVRLENYRAHMDHHTAVINMLYYKCSFCAYLIKAIKRGKEQMRSHLYEKHPEKLATLVSLKNVPSDCTKQSFVADEHSQDDYNSDTHEDSMSNSCSGKKNESKEVTESEQSPDVSESLQKNQGAISSDSITNNSQADIEPSSDFFDATLTKQTLRDGVECSVWSLNVGHTESPESTDLGPELLQISTTLPDRVNTRMNLMTEYSSSPKIFDVRSVTPDSYAELDGVTKEQVIVIASGDESPCQLVPGMSKESESGFVNMNVSGRTDQIVVSEDHKKDALLMKMEEHSLPMNLSQVMIIDQEEANMNLTGILQSTFTAPNTFVKLSDLTNSDEQMATGNAIKLWSGQTIIDVPGTQDKGLKHPNSLTVRKVPNSVEVWPKQSVAGLKQILPKSVLRSKHTTVQNVGSDIAERKNHVSNSHARVGNISRIITNIPTTYGGEIMDPLLCNIPKPPPLARIPQHLLEVPEIEDEVEEEEPQEMKPTSPRSMVKPWQKHKRPWRIALNPPIYTTGDIDYRCHLCGELINTSWSVLRNHFGTRHSQDYKLSTVTPRLLRMSSDFVSEGYKQVLGSKKRKSEGSIPISKRRRRWNPCRKRVEIHPLGPGLCVQQESVQDGEGNFVCKKCDQRCNDISSLRTHIGTNHRIKDHYLVCLECGENFVVEPSLQMHLKAFHSIQDPSTYMAENTGYAKEITETAEDESSTGIANQCHVCMAVFEDKLAVDKHLRVHGMAFLNRKRIEAQKAARNPEKKSKIDKPGDSLAATTQSNEKLEDQKLGKMESVDGTIRES